MKNEKTTNRSYEDIRLENIRKNKELLAGLNLVPLRDAVLKDLPKRAAVSAPKHKPAPKKPKTHTWVPLRSSLRLKGLAPDAKRSTPADPGPPMVPVQPPGKPVRPSEFDAAEALLAGDTAVLHEFARATTPQVEATPEMLRAGEDIRAWFAPFECRSAPHKVTPSRVYSMAFAPTTSKVLACVGDKVGSLALWDLTKYAVDPSPETVPPVCQLEPHGAVLSDLHFLDPHALLTLSFDATLRRLDLATQRFTTVYRGDDPDETLHALARVDSSVYIGTGHGRVLHVDLRAPRLIDAHAMHAKKCGCVHALGPLLLTSSNDTFLRRLDLRTLRVLEEYQHPRSCTSAYFDPTGTRIASTCYDSTLRVWQEPTVAEKPAVTISHGTETGKWVTPFRARWHPLYPEALLVASMNRHVNVYHGATGARLCRLYDAAFTAIPAVLAFHPTLPDLFIGGNNSGKAYIFTRPASD